MAVLRYGDLAYGIQKDESVLACLLRHGIDYPHACQAGVCQSCLIRGDGEIDPTWQTGIQDSLKAQGYFLACLAKPTDHLEVFSPLASECEVPAQILEIAYLTPNVMQLKLLVKDLSIWTPGQYINLINPEKTIRSYSIANLPAQDGFIELHIKLKDHGLMSTWLRHQAAVNDFLSLRGPLGNCFYCNLQKRSYPILLVGTGTGLAPLVAIARSALAAGHLGEINLLHGGLLKQDLYYTDTLEKLALSNPSFHYQGCVLNPQDGTAGQAIDQALLPYLVHPKTLHVFVCGPQEITKKLKMKAFLAGVPSSQISSDAFI